MAPTVLELHFILAGKIQVFVLQVQVLAPNILVLEAMEHWVHTLELLAVELHLALLLPLLALPSMVKLLTAFVRLFQAILERRNFYFIQVVIVLEVLQVELFSLILRLV